MSDKELSEELSFLERVISGCRLPFFFLFLHTVTISGFSILKLCFE